MPTIDENSATAVCCPAVCPALFNACDPLFAAVCNCAPMSDSACSAVLPTWMLVLIFVIVSVYAAMLESCVRAAIAKPSLTPMPA